MSKTPPYIVAALYKFTALPDYKDLRTPLLDLCESHGIKGTLLLAAEGINGTVAGARSGIDALKNHLLSDGRFEGWEYKESWAEEMPFYRMKVRLKKEIVTLGVPEVDPTQVVGTYVEAEAWNALIQDPEVVVIDTRNDYEVMLGTFKGALNPKTNSFREFPAYVRENLDPARHKKIAMMCTGGIRCEKASAFMKLEGFEEVYHLKGGILKYLEEVSPEKSLWEGECFVFDHRVTVGHGLEVGGYALCPSCRMPLSAADKQHPDYEEGVACAHCAEVLPPATRARTQAGARERHKQIQLARTRGQVHLGS